MLSEEEFTHSIEVLMRLGVLEAVPADRQRDELLRFKVPEGGLVARIVGGEFGEPPEGVELVAWFSCILLKILVEAGDASVSKEEFIAMAAILTGFMSEAAVVRLLHSPYDRPMISRVRAGQEKK
jgi:hypothetical protein